MFAHGNANILVKTEIKVSSVSRLTLRNSLWRPADCTRTSGNGGQECQHIHGFEYFRCVKDSLTHRKMLIDFSNHEHWMFIKY